MTQRQINAYNKRINAIWEEMEPVIAGTGVASLIEELIDLEILLETESNI